MQFAVERVMTDAIVPMVSGKREYYEKAMIDERSKQKITQ